MRTRILFLAPLVVLAVGLTACDKKTVVHWERSIKSSTVSCNFRGKDIWEGGGGTVLSVDVHCSFSSTAGGGEHPYALVYVSGCSAYRINGMNGDEPAVNLSCVGDPFYDVGFRACQTHGGPLPDDCTDKDEYDLRTIE